MIVLEKRILPSILILSSIFVQVPTICLPTTAFVVTSTFDNRMSACSLVEELRVPITRQFATSSENEDAIVVALTREAGKNEKMRKALLEYASVQHEYHRPKGIPSIQAVEVPCITHADGPDYAKLTDALRDGQWDYVAITSPEAARVLASAWPWSGEVTTTQQNSTTIKKGAKTIPSTPMSPPAVVAVGSATEKVLQEANIDVYFCPSKATANVLVEELPPIYSNDSSTEISSISNHNKSNTGGGSGRVLYPASAQAKTTLQTGLEQRGFCVTRLNTYDTVTAIWNDKEYALAATATVVCFASPSAVRGWMVNHKNNNHHTIIAVCIGETSAEACRELGWKTEDIIYPEKPGMEAWVESVLKAANSLLNKIID